MMYQINVWCFDIVDNRIVYSDDLGREITLEAQRAIAKELLEKWWGGRTLTNDGVIFSRIGETASENERAINRSLATNKPARLVDINDKTISIPVGALVDFAGKLDIERERSMDFWDNKLAMIESGSKEQLLKLIQDLLALQSITPI